MSLTILLMKLCGENYTLPLMLPLHFVLSALIYDILSIIADIKNFDLLHGKKGNTCLLFGCNNSLVVFPFLLQVIKK